MKSLLITHTDLDGISPIILMKLTNIDFEYKTLNIDEVDDYFNELNNDDVNNYDNIYITDLSLSKETYTKLISLNKTIKVFDHHETHLFANEYDFVTVCVELNARTTCATELFYEYLKENNLLVDKENIKTYVDYVRELDTFSFTSDIPKHLDMLKDIYGKIDFIKTIVRRLKQDKPFNLTSFEKRLVILKNKEIDFYVQSKEKEMKVYLINNKKCGVIFAEQNKSILGNYISEKYPDLDLVILINAAGGISYRTVRDDVSVSEFASIYGGGGHRRASGSRFSDLNRLEVVKSYFKDVKSLDENI